MSDYHEESHYQIALTNRQVLTAFVCLLACLFVAFFAGVWTGRETQAPVAYPDAEPVALEAKGREPFRFFDRDDDAAAPQGADGPSVEESAGAEGSAAGDTGDVGPNAGATGRATADTTLSAPEPMRRPDRAETASAQPVDRGADDGIVIQVYSGSDEAQAQGLVTRLEAAGHRAFLAPTEIDGATLYRVRVGPFSSRERAASRAEELESRLGLDTWIPPTP